MISRGTYQTTIISTILVPEVQYGQQVMAALKLSFLNLCTVFIMEENIQKYFFQK